MTAVRMLGYDSIEDIKTLDLNENAVSDFSRKKFKRLMEKYGKIQGIEVRWQKKDGTYIYVRENSVAVRNTKGKIIYYDGTIEDITARKIAEEALQRQTNILNIMMDTIPHPIYYKDINGYYLGCNIAFAKEAGLPKNKIIGKKVSEVAPKDFIDKYVEMDKELLEKGGSQSFKYKIRSHDGYIKDVFFNKTIFYNTDGTKGGLVGIYFDITALEDAEKHMHESEKKYHDLFENANDMIVIFEPDNEIVLDVNPKACEIFGYNYKELVGVSLKKLTKDVERGEKTIKSIMEQGRFKNYETAYIKKDGSIINMYANASVVDINGKKCILSISTDITELKNTVRALNDSETKFRTLYDSANDGIFLIKDYKIVDCNSKCMKIFDCKKEDLIGAYPFDLNFSPEFQDDGNSSEVKAKKYIDIALSGDSFSFEWKHKHLGGTVFDTEISLNKLQIGEDFFIQAILRDITERKQGEAEILKLSRAVRQSTASIMITDTNGKIEYINPKFCEITGYSPEEVLGRPTNIVKSGEMSDSYYEDLWNTIKSGKEWIGEFLNRKKNGELYWASSLISPIKNEKGDTINYLAISEDITEKKNKDEQLKNSLREIEVMLKEIHHRVKNNLQVILSLLKLQSEYITDERALEYFKVSEDRIKSMAMIHELLYGSENFSNINFYDYMKELASYLSLTYTTSDKDITIGLNIKDVYLSIDTAVPCGLLINELLTNAFKHAFKGRNSGKVDISMRLLIPDEVELIIKDDGIGFPLDVNVSDTKTLGLQLVTALVEQINGNLELSIEQGTKFRIVFPQNIYEKRL